MKRLSFLTAALVTFAFVGVMAAQTRDKVLVQVPYSFQVEGKVLPPGQYRIIEARRPDGGHSLLIQGKQDNMLKIVALTPASTIPAMEKPSSSETKVVLWKLGATYYLDKVWMKGKTVGWQIPLGSDAKNPQGQSVELSATFLQGQPEAHQSGDLSKQSASN
jgi:hypothetical protein